VMNGELWIAQVYSGDVIYKAKDRKDIKFFCPQDGFSIFVDNLTISGDSTHKEEAYLLINFLLEPQNAARQTNVFRNPTTVEAESFLDEESRKNSQVYFPQNVLQRGEFFKDMGEEEDEYVKIFNLLKHKSNL